MNENKISMEIVNSNAAGIDIGSRSHWVAVGQKEEDIKEFGVFNEDLKNLSNWLKEKNIQTVAMESTGTYWQTLYAILLADGFQVILCNGKFTKNIKGRKTDVQDCQWIQKLHRVSYSTVLSIMSEVGLEGIKKFPTAKHFASWLRLTPNNKISGGKILSNRIPKGSNRLKIALRNAANAIGNLKDSTPLSDFFKRINFRKGRASAISATARKLAIIIWNMVVKNQSYVNPEGYLFLDEKRKLGLVKRIQKQITKFGLTNEDISFATS